MTLGPGAVVAGRYEIVRALGGDPGSGHVFLAHDRDLEREVALRVVEGAPAAARMLLADGRRMSAVHPRTPAAVAVLDMGELPGGGSYVACEMITGTALDDIARQRAPLPVEEAVGHAVALLDASIAARRYAGDASEPVAASALLTPEGAVRVTRFVDAAGTAPAGAEPSVAATAETLLDLLARSEPSPAVGSAIDDALAGRIRSAEELRGRLSAAIGEMPPAVVPPPPPVERMRPRSPWVVVALVALLALAAGLFLLLRDDGEAAEVPQTAGQTAAEAVATLRDAGFTARTARQTHATVARGVVIGTSPAAGARADGGSEVVVNVSEGSGEAVVPVLTGLRRDDARRQLERAGLTGRFLAAGSATVPVGAVVSQEPAAGLRIPVGSAVAVTISVGAPAVVPVPDLTGQSVEGAAVSLVRSGLRPGAVRQEVRADVAPGTVVAQDPAPATRVVPGTEVDVVAAAR